jgi:uncharacterized membrane protein
MTTSTAHQKRASALRRLLITNAAGVLVGVVVGLFAGPAVGVLGGWDVASAAFVGSVWLTIGRLDAAQTGRYAAAEDPTQAGADLLLISAAIASLIAVGFVLGGAARGGGGGAVPRVALALGSVVLSWALVHTVFALSYARRYYAAPRGGVDFNEREPPDFRDFAYLSFTIGMTFQVSDTALRSKPIRRMALRHALLSYAFGAGIIGATINLIASITGK